MEAISSEMVKAIEQLSVSEQHKMQDLNRKSKRQRLRIRHGSGGMISRFRSGARTGTTPHFAFWMADLKIKSALQRTTLVSLADRIEDESVATAYALLNQGGFKSVWDLTQADARDLLRVKGIGPKRLETVKRDLASHQVAVKW